MANYFDLSTGVRVSGNQPIDGDRYIATDIATRDSLVQIRGYEGLQVFIESGDTANTGLWVLVKIDTVGGTKIGTWEKINSNNNFDINITNPSTGQTITYQNGEWINSDFPTIPDVPIYNAGSGVTVTAEGDDYIIDSIAGVSGFTLDTNIITLTLLDGTTSVVDLDYLVDTDSYVVSGVFDPVNDGTINFELNNGSVFAVSGISNGSLDALQDTDLSSLVDNDILVYDSVSGKWIPEAISTLTSDDYINADLTATLAAGGVSVNDSFPSGTTFEQLFRAILSPTIDATIQNSASANLLSVPTSDAEIGTTYNFQMTSTFNKGRIRSQENYPTATYVDLVGEINTTIYSGPGSNPTGAVVHTGIASQTYSVSITSLVGTNPYKDSSGTIVHNLDSSRGPVTKTYSRTIKNFYKYFYNSAIGALSDTSAVIRTYSNELESSFTTSDGVNKPVPAGNRYYTISIVIPVGHTHTSFYVEGSVRNFHVLNTTSSNANVTAQLTTDTINVNDAAGVPVSYTKYTHAHNAYGGDVTYTIYVEEV